MSKDAAVCLAKSLGGELAGDNTLVNCVCAEIVDTVMWDLIDREVTQRMGQPTGSFKVQAVGSVSIGRIQKGDDVANMVIYLASSDGSYIAGQALNWSGGLLPY